MAGETTIQEATLRGSIQQAASLSGLINEVVSLSGSVNLYTETEYYDGSYTITPRISQQILNTDNKQMASDLTVEAIPYQEVHNLHGGMTVTIGRI